MDIQLFNKETYSGRRNNLANKLGRGKILFIGNQESSINFKDNWYPFKQDSTFLYYTGLNIPNLYLIIDIDAQKSTLYGNELTIDDIIWTGPLPSLRELADKVGIEHIEPLDQLAKTVGKDIMYLPPYRPEHNIFIHEATGIALSDIDDGASTELIRAVVSQRNIKDNEEIKSLHVANTITAEMHLEVMKRAKDGMFEYELVGAAREIASKHNTSFSFQPICTINGHILHNHAYHNQLRKGGLSLFDGGLYSNMNYAGDMTRTFPIDRRFSSLQTDIYQIVLNAQKSAIRASRAGTFFKDVHMKAALRICEGMIDLGFMKGHAEDAAQAGAHTLFFQHGLGHLIGLDVHDMENLGENHVGYGDELERNKAFGFRSLRLGRKLVPGFAITIEPGIYIIPALIDKFESEGLYKDFINYDNVRKISDFGGIRIEDDYLITVDGIELLGEPLAKEVKEIEKIREEALS